MGPSLWPLVRVSSTRFRAYTSRLSTCWSCRGLHPDESGTEALS